MKEYVELIPGRLAEILTPLLPDDVYIVCIGTDRSTGDSLGPLTGTFLLQKGFQNVFGTLKEPVHAVNLPEYVERLQGKFVLAIDAGLGRPESVGKIIVANAPVNPGAGVNKTLPAIGDVSLSAIVNIYGYMNYLVLANTPLSVVWDMAEYIAQELCAVLE